MLLIWRFVLRIERSLFCVPVYDTLFVSRCIFPLRSINGPEKKDLKKFLTKGGGGGREGGLCESIMEQFLIEGEWQYLGLNLLMKENQMNILSFSKMCFLIVELYTTFIS